MSIVKQAVTHAKQIFYSAFNVSIVNVADCD